MNAIWMQFELIWMQFENGVWKTPKSKYRITKPKISIFKTNGDMFQTYPLCLCTLYLIQCDHLSKNVTLHLKMWPHINKTIFTDYKQHKGPNLFVQLQPQSFMTFPQIFSKALHTPVSALYFSAEMCCNRATTT